jgi:hypothetical protein
VRGAGGNLCPYRDPAIIAGIRGFSPGVVRLDKAKSASPTT